MSPTMSSDSFVHLLKPQFRDVHTLQILSSRSGLHSGAYVILRVTAAFAIHIFRPKAVPCDRGPTCLARRDGDTTRSFASNSPPSLTFHTRSCPNLLLLKLLIDDNDCRLGV